VEEAPVEIEELQKIRGELYQVFLYRQEIFNKLVSSSEYTQEECHMYSRMITNLICKGSIPAKSDKSILESILVKHGIEI
jgi:hypothetical protein